MKTSQNRMRYWLSPTPLAISFLAIMGPAVAQTHSISAPIVRLSCASEYTELCAAAMQVVAELSGGKFDVHLADPNTGAVINETDLTLKLTVDGQGENWISAHFDWQVGTDGACGAGQSFTTNVLDASFSASAYARFIETMIREDAGLSSALSATTD